MFKDSHREVVLTQVVEDWNGTKRIFIRTKKCSRSVIVGKILGRIR